jgi:hypothetical protein
MKNFFALLAFLLITVQILAQEEKEFEPRIAVKWAPTGLLLGSLSFQGEINLLGRTSLTAKIGIPANTRESLPFEGKDAIFNMKATSFLAGYRMYFSKKRFNGIYFEPYFKYVHHTSEGSGQGTVGMRNITLDFTNNYNGFGLGGQMGVQFLVRKRFVIDLFLLGPEINASKNNFTAREVSNSLPWTTGEASDAEASIHEFINQFPFIRNRTNTMVDAASKTVTADFKGALPGIRSGFSIGFTF